MPVFRHPAGEGDLGAGQVGAGVSASLVPEASMGQTRAGTVELYLAKNWSTGFEAYPVGDLPSGAVFIRRHARVSPSIFVAAHAGAQLVHGSFFEEVELDGYIAWGQQLSLMTVDLGGVATYRPWDAVAATIGYGAQLGRLSGHRTCWRDVGQGNDEACVADGDFEPALYPIIHSLTGSLRLGHPRVGAELHGQLWLNPSYSEFAEYPDRPWSYGGGLYVAW